MSSSNYMFCEFEFDFHLLHYCSNYIIFWPVCPSVALLQPFLFLPMEPTAGPGRVGPDMGNFFYAINLVHFSYKTV